VGSGNETWAEWTDYFHHTPVFWQRVQKGLKRKELSFARVQKNAKEGKRVRKNMKGKGLMEVASNE